MSDKFTKLATMIMGLVTLGWGGWFLLWPVAAGKRGFSLDADTLQKAENQTALRVFGARDFTFGLGMLLARQDPAQARHWFKFMTVCSLGDTLAFGLGSGRASAQKRPDQLKGALLSLGFAAFFWLFSKDKGAKS